MSDVDEDDPPAMSDFDEDDPPAMSDFDEDDPLGMSDVDDHPLAKKKKRGRPPWATPEQSEFLQSFMKDMDTEKKKYGGLTQYYGIITVEFYEKWPTEATTEERKQASDPQAIQKLADARRASVSYRSHPYPTNRY
jgi:hypothetical protein